MYNSSINFNNVIKNNSRTFKCKVDIGTTSLTETSVIDFVIENQLSADNLPSIGNVVASKLTLKLIRDGITPSYFTTQKIKPYVALEVTTGVFEYIPLGVFKPNLDNIKKTDKSIEIECFDCLAFLDSFPYITDKIFPQTVATILTEIQTITGYTIKNIGTLPTASIKVMPIDSVRNVLGIIAQLLSANVVTNQIGEIEFRMIKDSNFTLNSNNYMDFKLISDETCSVTRLESKQRGEDTQLDNSIYTGNTTGATLTIDNENITTQIENDVIFNRAFPITYYAYELKLQGMPMLEVGDLFTLTDVKSVVRKLPIFMHKLTFNGGLISEFKANAPKINESNSSGSNGSGSITQSINKLDIKVFAVEELLAGNLTADNIFANSITAQKLHADIFTAIDARIEELIVENLTVTDLSAINASIESLVAFKATITTLIAGNIDATNIKAGTIVAGSSIVAVGAIGTAQISDLNASKINAGTVDTSKVTIQGANGRMKMANNRIQVFEYPNHDILQPLFERVSLGDVNGDGTVYGLKIRGLDGNTIMIDELGVKNAGITDGAITNPKISDTANIAGSKLDIASVITSVNGSTTKIAGSSIMMDNETLDIAFSTQTNDITSNSEDIQQHNLDISANAEGLATKVSSQTFNTLEQTVSTHSTFVEQFDTNYKVTIESAKALADANADALEYQSNYFDFTAGGLVLGTSKGINDNLKVRISSTSMDFLDNGTPVAYINNQQMMIDQAKIISSIQVGNHMIEKYASDVTLFRWVG